MFGVLRVFYRAHRALSLLLKHAIGIVRFVHRFMFLLMLFADVFLDLFLPQQR